MEELRRNICGIISQELKINPQILTENVNLRDIESVDSINLVRVIARIEDQFDVELDDDLVFKITTIDELVDAVDHLTKAGASSS